MFYDSVVGTVSDQYGSLFGKFAQLSNSGGTVSTLSVSGALDYKFIALNEGGATNPMVDPTKIGIYLLREDSADRELTDFWYDGVHTHLFEGSPTVHSSMSFTDFCTTYGVTVNNPSVYDFSTSDFVTLEKLP